ILLQLLGECARRSRIILLHKSDIADPIDRLRRKLVAWVHVREAAECRAGFVVLCFGEHRKRLLELWPTVDGGQLVWRRLSLLRKFVSRQRAEHSRRRREMNGASRGRWPGCAWRRGTALLRRAGARPRVFCAGLARRRALLCRA